MIYLGTEQGFHHPLFMTRRREGNKGRKQKTNWFIKDLSHLLVHPVLHFLVHHARNDKSVSFLTKSTTKPQHIVNDRTKVKISPKQFLALPFQICLLRIHRDCLELN